MNYVYRNYSISLPFWIKIDKEKAINDVLSLYRANHAYPHIPYLMIVQKQTELISILGFCMYFEHIYLLALLVHISLHV